MLPWAYGHKWSTHRHRHRHRCICSEITSQIARITFNHPLGWLPAAVRVHNLVVPAETFRQVPRFPNHRYPLPACCAGSTTTSAVTWPSGEDALRRLSSAFTGPRLCSLFQITHIFRIEVFGPPCWTQGSSPTADSCSTSHREDERSMIFGLAPQRQANQWASPDTEAGKVVIMERDTAENPKTLVTVRM